MLARTPDLEGVRGYCIQDVEVGADGIVWWGKTPNDPGDRADFWAVPRTGGEECSRADATAVPRPPNAPVPTGKVRTCTTVQKGAARSSR
ncbi:hypothetical protein [Streptosporangium sp. NPDC051022]|uniref:hypothetical protein n=1 Tax=Streptosporangium sp. NPDC051022 TaxID=3155752 RepID=UPI00342B00ED